MSDPADLAKTMKSLHLNPEVAKKIADLEEQNAGLVEQVAQLEARDTKRGKEIKILREMDYHQRDKIGELEAELDASKCTEEEYRIEIDRLERQVDVDLLEKNFDLLEKNEKLTARNESLEAQAEAHAKDADVEMQDAYKDLRPVCRHCTAGSCRHGEKCKYGRHPANTAEATTSTAGTHNTTGGLELQSAK